MGRRPRYEYPGGVYHLIQRGNNRGFIFDKTEDKDCLLGLIEEYKGKGGFWLFGYVIMGNHYHLIVKLSEMPLKDIMHRINNKFARGFNIKNGRTGHVFENRYKSIPVMDDKYLLSLLRYVHQNPTNANICEKIKDYNWSSDKFYRHNLQGGLVDIDFILNLISPDRASALRAYIEFMDENKKEEISVFEDVDVIGRVNTKKIDEYIRSNVKTLDQILREITKDERIYQEIKHGSRRRYLSAYKKGFIEVALKFNYTMEEIGRSISISDAAVFKIFNAD